MDYNDKYKEFYALRHFPEVCKSFKQIDIQNSAKKRPTSSFRCKRHTTEEEDKIHNLQLKLNSLNKSCLGDINDLALVYGNIRQCRSLRQRPQTSGARSGSSSRNTLDNYKNSNLQYSKASPTSTSPLETALNKLTAVGIPTMNSNDTTQNVLLVLDSLFAILQYRGVQLSHRQIDPTEFQERLFLTLGVKMSSLEINSLLESRQQK